MKLKNVYYKNMINTHSEDIKNAVSRWLFKNGEVQDIYKSIPWVGYLNTVVPFSKVEDKFSQYIPKWENVGIDCNNKDVLKATQEDFERIDNLTEQITKSICKEYKHLVGDIIEDVENNKIECVEVVKVEDEVKEEVSENTVSTPTIFDPSVNTIVDNKTCEELVIEDNNNEEESNTIEVANTNTKIIITRNNKTKNETEEDSDNGKRKYVSNKDFVLYLTKGSDEPSGFICLKKIKSTEETENQQFEIVLTEKLGEATRLSSVESNRIAMEYQKNTDRYPFKLKIVNYGECVF